jgi:hypothetical protein
MQVNPINRPTVDAAGAARPVTASATEQTDQGSFRGAEALNQALAAEEPVRASEVQRGRELMANVQYPPTEMIRRLSRLLADNWESQN